MSETPSYPLHDAARNGDIDALNRLLSEGADVDGRDEIGRTPLFCAARNGEANAARHLLKRGARVDCEMVDGTTALMTAARGGHAEMVRILLKSGADPNQIIHPQPVVLTPEMTESVRKMRESLKASFGLDLPEVPAEPEPTGPIQANTLARAIMSRDAETIMALLDAGADVNYSAGRNGMSPLRAAVSFSDPEIIRALIDRGASVDSPGSCGDVSILAAAVMKERVDVARLLLERGAVANADVMRFAVVKSDIEMIKLLLEFGADPDERKNGVAHVAVMARGKPEIMALFEAHRGTDWHALVTAGDLPGVRSRLDAGANVDVRSEDGETALMLAAKAGHADIAQLLLERGAQPDAATKFQVTALMYGVQKGHVDVVRTLLAHGADVNATNKWGQTAFFRATAEDKREIRQLLIDAGATVGTVEAALMGDSERVMRFLADGVPVDQTNSAGLTTLMAAAVKGDTELVVALHDRGADMSPRDNLGETAFHYAVQYASGKGETGLIALMLEWGVDVNTVGKHDSNVLSAPVMTRSEPVLRFLLDRGANPNGQSGTSGQPLLHIAIMLGRGTLTTINTLLDYGADVEAADRMGSTSLMEAIKLPKTPVDDGVDGDAYVRAVAKLLIDRGANVNASGKTGSVLGLAINRGDIELVRMLLDAGADVNGPGSDNLLARWSMSGNEAIAALLRERGASVPEPGDIWPAMPAELASTTVGGKPGPGFMDKLLDMFNKRRQKQKDS